MNNAEIVQSFGFAEPQVTAIGEIDGIPMVHVRFVATEPEMVVRCHGSVGIDALVPVPGDFITDGELDNDVLPEVIELAARACLQTLTEAGAV